MRIRNYRLERNNQKKEVASLSEKKKITVPTILNATYAYFTIYKIIYRKHNFI
jgi:hypothetical protein